VLFEVVGLTVSANPELYLRLPALAAFALAVVAVYGIAVRAGADILWAAGVALAFGSTPLFLFYAFEARTYSFCALLVVVFLALLAAVAEGRGGTGIGIAAAAVGALLPWAHPWNACVVVALAALLPVVFWRAGRKTGLRLAATLAPGAAFTLLQWLWFRSIRAPGHQGLPFFDPQPFAAVFWSTVNGPFLSLLTGEPELVLFALLGLAVARARGRLGWWVGASVVAALALSVLAMWRVGLGVSPRHQVGLYGGIFVALALAQVRASGRVLLAILVGLNLVLLPRTVDRVLAKGNAGRIAAVVRADQREASAPVVVQHSYAMGYPDPLLTFPLAFYLGPAGHGGSHRVLELPSHRDVTDLEIDRPYFLDPARTLPEFERSDEAGWIDFLRATPDRALFLVTTRASPANVRQAKSYERALAAAGFSRSGQSLEFDGYPPARLALWVRARP